MSIIRAIKHRLGLSVTPGNNFVLDASADNGTMKLARESGQDIMTVDAAGKVAFPQGIGPDGTWTPVITSASGALGSVTVQEAKYQKHGRQVDLYLTFTIVNNGTGTVRLLITGLPFVSSCNTHGTARDVSVTGKLLQWFINDTVSFAEMVNYDNSYPVVTGSLVYAHISYLTNQ